jgi:hypothetical protein
MIFSQTCCTISVYSSTKRHVFQNVTFFGSWNIRILHKRCAEIQMFSSRAERLRQEAEDIWPQGAEKDIWT